MQNLDAIKQKKDELRNALAEAIRANDENQIGAAMDGWMQFVSDTVMAEASGISDAADRSILAARGIRQLTAEETKFYQDFIANARQDAQTVITNITSALPQTVIDSVMDDIKAAYPLLDMIDFTNTGAAIKWVLNAQGAQAATWDELNTSITKDLAGAIQVVDLTQNKLSAYMYTTQDMLDLGPQWVDRYVRALLADALAAGLETAIVDGNGLKQPIGMTRNFTGSFNSSTGYARKSATSVTSLDPTTYGTLLATLAVDGITSKPRPVSRVVLIVNPADYFTKVMPATTVLTPMGTYVSNVLPFPTDVIQSVGVPSGKAVLGLAKKYFMGVGTGRGGKLEYSDDFKFVDDLRTYKIKLYGMGRPHDINAFAYLDISNLAPIYPTYNSNVSGEIENTPQTT
jgi:HK97 family phage major capsid protein